MRYLIAFFCALFTQAIFVSEATAMYQQVEDTSEVIEVSTPSDNEPSSRVYGLNFCGLLGGSAVLNFLAIAFALNSISTCSKDVLTDGQPCDRDQLPEVYGHGGAAIASVSLSLLSEVGLFIHEKDDDITGNPLQTLLAGFLGIKAGTVVAALALIANHPIVAGYLMAGISLGEFGLAILACICICCIFDIFVKMWK